MKPVFESKKHYHALLEDHIAKLSALQQLLYASNHHAILLIFQAMDAAGKDGAIKHVISGVNPQGCQVFSFKHPSATELEHDFLSDEQRVWQDRYRSIVDLERHLSGNGTHIIKFYLHLSKDEQQKRFLERIDEPDKTWKFSVADINELPEVNRQSSAGVESDPCETGKRYA